MLSIYDDGAKPDQVGDGVASLDGVHGQRRIVAVGDRVPVRGEQGQRTGGGFAGPVVEVVDAALVDVQRDGTEVGLFAENLLQRQVAFGGTGHVDQRGGGRPVVERYAVVVQNPGSRQAADQSAVPLEQLRLVSQLDAESGFGGENGRPDSSFQVFQAAVGGEFRVGDFGFQLVQRPGHREVELHLAVVELDREVGRLGGHGGLNQLEDPPVGLGELKAGEFFAGAAGVDGPVSGFGFEPLALGVDQLGGRVGLALATHRSWGFLVGARNPASLAAVASAFTAEFQDVLRREVGAAGGVSQLGVGGGRVSFENVVQGGGIDAGLGAGIVGEAAEIADKVLLVFAVHPCSFVGGAFSAAQNGVGMNDDRYVRFLRDGGTEGLRLAEGLLPHPEFWILKVVQAGVASRVSSVAVTQDGSNTEVVFGPEGADGDEERATAYIAAAARTLSELGQRSLRLEIAGEPGWTMATPRGLETGEGPVATETRLRVQHPRGGEEPLGDLLSLLAFTCPVPLTFNGEPVVARPLGEGEQEIGWVRGREWADGPRGFVGSARFVRGAEAKVSRFSDVPSWLAWVVDGVIVGLEEWQWASLPVAFQLFADGSGLALSDRGVGLLPSRERDERRFALLEDLRAVRPSLWKRLEKDLPGKSLLRRVVVPLAWVGGGAASWLYPAAIPGVGFVLVGLMITGWSQENARDTLRADVDELLKRWPRSVEAAAMKASG